VAVAVPVLTQPRRASLSGLFVSWHLLSLDAPTVAMLWAWVFARAAHVHGLGSAIAVLGIGTWLIYVTDRLLDSHAAAPRDALRDRHHFHAKHRRAFLAAAGVGAAALLWLIVARLSATARRDDAAIFTAFLVYFVFVHLIGSRFPRSFAVGIIFAAATAAPAWSQVRLISAGWIAAVALFAGLCWLNCAAIHAWEQQSPPVGLPRIPLMAVCVAGAAGALAVASVMVLRDPEVLRLAVCILASALLLLALHFDSRRLAGRAGEGAALGLRVLADAALLTPILFVLPWRL
jgi:hypothetical protein